ncbi:MAG: histidine--tRNA ligase [bacterium]|nr:histidine--tRNA ligase [bacterium]
MCEPVKVMIKPTPISGFPEWLPAQRLIEQRYIDTIRRVYELYGYTSLETSAVEKVSVLKAKGEVDKEIYAIGRLQGEPQAEWEMALHFDLTVPFARYVGQNYGNLHFPFKRYQIQKVWRGERPQEGRFREFYQADIDVIAEDALPLQFDAEMPAIIHEVFQKLGIRAQIRVNNRKLLKGYYSACQIPDEQLTAVLREADKLEKIGESGVEKSLRQLGLAEATIAKCLTLSKIKGDRNAVLSQLKDLKSELPDGDNSQLFAQGISELEFIARELDYIPSENLIFDLGIVRGLDYYTGTIYETCLPDYPTLGSICSGGRYDNLASEFINRKLPGVGISIGLSRLLAHLFKCGAENSQRQCPTEYLITWPEEALRPACLQIARYLRQHGIAAEVYHEPQSLKKQVRYADRRGIPQVIFPHLWTPEEQTVEVKNLADGTQKTVQLSSLVNS